MKINIQGTDINDLISGQISHGEELQIIYVHNLPLSVKYNSTLLKRGLCIRTFFQAQHGKAREGE